MMAPKCEIHCADSVIDLADWVDRAEIDTNGLVASVIVPAELLDFDSLTELSHAEIANIRYHITSAEPLKTGEWKLRLYTEDGK